MASKTNTAKEGKNMSEAVIDLDAIELPEPEDDEELAPAADIVKLAGKVSKSAKLYTDVDTGMPIVQFGLELAEPFEDYSEVMVQVRGGDEMIQFAMLIREGSQATAEGRYSVGEDGVWVFASVLRLIERAA